MGAYALIANNELIHLGMALVIALITYERRSDWTFSDPHDLYCYGSIDRETYSLLSVHLISAFFLAMPRIYKFFERKKTKPSLKVYNQTSFNINPIVFDILSLVTLALYVALLFSANRFYFDCKESLDGKYLIIEWIRLEMVVFLINMIGIFMFLALKAIMSRCRAKI